MAVKAGGISKDPQASDLDRRPQADVGGRHRHLR